MTIAARSMVIPKLLTTTQPIDMPSTIDSATPLGYVALMEPLADTSPASIVPQFTWSRVSRLMRLSNQTGTWLLVLPTLWTLVLAAQGVPPWHLVVIFFLGSFVMRSAGVVLNDLADRTVDRQVTRTQRRPLASGELTPAHACIVLVLLLTLAALLVFRLNRLTIQLSPIALLLAAVYPFAKRAIHIPQAMLGIAFGWVTIMAWTASRGTVDGPAWYIFAATICWAIAYDTIYALQDREDDRRIGVKSSALFFGRWTWLAVGVACMAMLCLLGIAGWLAGTNRIFYGILIAVAVVEGKQAWEIRNPVSPARAFALFRQHVWIGLAILLGSIGGFEV